MARAHRGWKTRLGSVELRAQGCHMPLGLQQQLGASCPDRALPRLLSPWVLGVTGGGRAEQWSSAARENEPESSAGADSAAHCSCPPGLPALRCPCVGGSCPTGHGIPSRSCCRDTATRLALRGELGQWAALGPLPLHLQGLALPAVHIGEQTLASTLKVIAVTVSPPVDSSSLLLPVDLLELLEQR